ncbi:MAG: hypothetical protein IJJ07_04235 [Lachnospiraceae bacterium]|nr:hypothetical protein [Lachnospiraceae bacterium]
MGEIRFDPYSGEPIAPKETAAPQTPKPSEAPQTSAPAPKKKGKKGGLIAGIIAALVVVGGIFAFTKFFNNPTPYGRIKKAAENAFVQDEMTEQFNEVKDIMGDGTYAMDGTFDVGGQKVKVEADTDKGDLSAKISVAGLGGAVYMDDKTITVDASALGLGILGYDYASDKADKADSYIGSAIGTQNLQAVDMLLKMFHAAAAMDEERREEIQDLIDEKCESLEYEEIERQDQDVNYSFYECDGYSTTVSGEFLADLLDDVSEKAFGKSLTDLSDELASLSGSAGEATGILAQLKEMDDIELSFYIDDDENLRKVDIKASTDNQNIDSTLTLEDEEIPWHDMTFKDNNSDFYIAWDVTENGDATTYELNVFDYRRLRIEYGGGDLGFTLYNANDDEFLGGTLENGEDEVTVNMNDLPDKNMNGKIVISDDSNVAKAPAAKDILNMSQSDFEQLAEIISRLMYGL